jgi:integrase
MGALLTSPHCGKQPRPYPGVKEPSARKGFLERQKFEELVALLPTHLRPLVLFLYWCGVRLGEAQQIEWPQVNLTNRTIRLEKEQTKNAEPRYVPLPSVPADMLSEVEPKTESAGSTRPTYGRNGRNVARSAVLAVLSRSRVSPTTRNKHGPHRSRLKAISGEELGAGTGCRDHRDANQRPQNAKRF